MALRALLASALSACVPSGSLPAADAAPHAGHFALALTRDDDDATPVVLPQGGDARLVIDFWAPSCEPCARFVPGLEARRAELASLGVELAFVARATDESAAELRGVLARWGVAAPSFIDRAGAALRLGVQILPCTLLVERGAVAWVSPVGASPEDVVQRVALGAGPEGAVSCFAWRTPLAGE